VGVAEDVATGLTSWRPSKFKED